MDCANLVGGTAADRQRLRRSGPPALSSTPVKRGKQGELSIPRWNLTGSSSIKPS